MKVCDGPGCTKAIPAGRRLYCSVECGKRRGSRIAAVAQSANFKRLHGDKDIGLRTCLRCDNKMFLSEGPWNRFCPKCANRAPDAIGRRASGAGEMSKSIMDAIAGAFAEED